MTGGGGLLIMHQAKGETSPMMLSRAADQAAARLRSTKGRMPPWR